MADQQEARKTGGRYDTRKVAKLDYAWVNRKGLVQANDGQGTSTSPSTKLAKLDHPAEHFRNDDQHQPSTSPTGSESNSLILEDVKRKEPKYRVKLLTERRKTLIGNFLRQTTASAIAGVEQYGKLGSQQWTNNLIECLGERNQRQKTTPFDVQSWITDGEFCKEYLQNSPDWTPDCWLMSVEAPGNMTTANDGINSAENVDSTPSSSFEQKENAEQQPLNNVKSENANESPSSSTLMQENDQVDQSPSSTVQDDDDKSTEEDGQADDELSSTDEENQQNAASVSPSPPTSPPAPEAHPCGSISVN